jgi:hypothetical protein
LQEKAKDARKWRLCGRIVQETKVSAEERRRLKFKRNRSISKLELFKEMSSKTTDEKKLGDRLYIGMRIQEIVSLLGSPTGINPGTEMLECSSGSKTVVSDKMRSELSKTMHYLWKRPEGMYALVIVDGKLARVFMKP